MILLQVSVIASLKLIKPKTITFLTLALSLLSASWKALSNTPLSLTTFSLTCLIAEAISIIGLFLSLDLNKSTSLTIRV